MKVKELLRTAGPQYGAFTYEQALRLMSRRQLVWLLQQGVARRVMPNTYVMTGFENSWHQRAKVAELSVQGSAVSHRAALRLWGLLGERDQRIALTIPQQSARSRHGVDIHRSEQLEPFVVMHQGIRVTSVARTLVDVSSQATPSQLGSYVDWACNKKLVTLAEIQHCLDRMITKGRSRISFMREVLGARTEIDNEMDTMPERKLLTSLRDAGFSDPVAQHRLVANGSVYILDFAYVDGKIAIEADGPHHRLPSVMEYDQRRDADLALEGWIVVRVPSESDPREKFKFLREALTRRSKTKTPA